jgi:hypothetical protein
MTIAQLLPHNHRGQNSLGALEQRIALEEGVSAMSLRRWRSLYERNGYAGLLRKQRADSGRSSFLWKHPRWTRVIAAGLADGLCPYTLAKHLARRFGPDAPKYDVILSYANHQYSVDGKPASRESAVAL